MISYLAILGGNALACPAIKHLKDLGYNTLVLDRNHAAPASKLASKFVAADFSNFREADEATSSLDLVGVMAINDFGVRTASHLSKARGLPGYHREAALNVTNKVQMKQKWIKAGLSTPRFTWATKYDILKGKDIKWHRFPCIIKPAFSGGGSRGVFLVHDYGEIRERLQASQSVYIDDEVIIEECIQGTEHTMEVLIFEGKTHVISISDKENYPGSISVVQNLYFPGRIGHRFKKRLEVLVSQACQALGLTNGCAHCEVLIRDQDIFLLEFGGRPGGGLNFHPICELSSGYDYPLELARILTGRAPLFNRKKESFCLGWHFFTTRQGVLRKVRGFEEIRNHPNVVDAQLYVEVGQKLPDRSNDLARPGFFLVYGEDFEEVDRLVEELDNMIYFEVDEG